MNDLGRSERAAEPPPEPVPSSTSEMHALLHAWAHGSWPEVVPVHLVDGLHVVLVAPERAVSAAIARRLADLVPLPTALGTNERSAIPTPAPEERAATEDPAAGLLHSEAAIAYRNGNAAYLALKNPKYKFIGITSGRRTSAEQFVLYRDFLWWKFFGGQPKANSADVPGRSMHEYGFAIDIVHKADSQRLKKTLEANGWTASHSPEPWHYDATGVASWKRLQAYVNSGATKPSDELRTHLTAMLKAKKLYEENEPEYARKKKQLKPELDRLENERKSLATRLTQLEREQKRLQMEQGWITTSQQKLEQMRRAYQQMTYTACPNGQPYAECTHNALKQQYDNERAALATKISALGAEIAERRERYENDVTRHSAAVRLYDADRRRYEVAAATFREQHAEFFRLHDQMAAWKATYSAEESNVNRLLGTIASVVKAFA